MLNLLNVGFVGSAGSSASEYESMYESRSDLTTLQKQHVVEWFSGKELDTDRWNIVHSAGNDSNSPNVMSDTVDGGFQWTTHGSNSGYYGNMDFNGIKQYNPISSVWIAVTRNHTTTDTAHYVGLTENSYFMLSASGNATYFKLGTRNDTIGTGSTDTSIASDTNWHTWKGETNGTTVTLHGDGVLEASRTYPIPSTATGTLQPNLQVYNSNSGTSKTSSIRYFEAYNT
jgi:hypothetical protein